MAFRTSPQLGPSLEAAVDAPAFYDVQGATEASYQLGQVHQGSDGYDYIWVVAGAALLADGDVAIADGTFVATDGGGTGAWVAPIDVANGQYFHARVADEGYA